MRERHSDAGIVVGAGPPRPASAPAERPADGPSAHRHSRTWLIRRAELLGWDALAWLFALALAAALRHEFVLAEIDHTELRTLVLVAIGAQLVIGGALQTYCGRYYVGSVENAINVTAATLLAGVVVFLAAVLVQPPLLRSIPLLAVPIAVLLTVGSRVAVRLYRERRYRPDYRDAQRVIIYGAGPEGQHLMRLMLSDPGGGFLPVALLDDNMIFRRRRISGITVHGTRADIAAAAAGTRADLIVIADRSLPPEALREVVDAARDAGLRVSMVPVLSELLQPLPAMTTVPTPRPPADGPAPEGTAGRENGSVAVLPAPQVESRAKRLLDLTLCLASVLIVLPLLALVAAALKISNGPVLYRAERIGRDGRPFTMFKFATMVERDGPRVTGRNDARITPIGRWLRATKLNELPQIFNVIKGDMSLVGPRPEDPRYAAQYSTRQQRVFAVRPGMTSLAFLEFGDEQAFIARVGPGDVEAFYLRELLPEKLDIELRYLDNWTMREDLRILARTFARLLW